MALQTPWGHPGGVTPGQAPSGMLLDDKHILVNVDADNILDYHATQTLAERMYYVPLRGGFRCSGKDSGVTGRIGARAKAFLQVGGYLETLLGSGTQDIDLWNAMKMLAGSAPKLRFPGGESIPNSLDKTAKNEQKIKNLQPHSTANTWAKMNKHNWGISRGLLDAKQWWRNYDSEPHKPPTGKDTGVWGGEENGRKRGGGEPNLCRPKRKALNRNRGRGE